MPKKVTTKASPKKASPKSSPSKAKAASPKRIASPKVKAAVTKTTKQKKEAAPKKTILTPKSSKYKQMQRLIEDAAENSSEKRSVRTSKERKRSTMLKSKDFLYFDTKRRAAKSTEILEDEISE